MAAFQPHISITCKARSGVHMSRSLGHASSAAPGMVSTMSARAGPEVWCSFRPLRRYSRPRRASSMRRGGSLQRAAMQACRLCGGAAVGGCGEEGGRGGAMREHDGPAGESPVTARVHDARRFVSCRGGRGRGEGGDPCLFHLAVITAVAVRAALPVHAPQPSASPKKRLAPKLSAAGQATHLPGGPP